MNTQIIEDYCDFETAKLLKEKGFNAPTCGFYYDDYTEELIVSSPSNHNGSINAFSAPSQGHVMKWLREVHNIEINILMSALNSDNSREYMFDVFFTNERYLEPSKTKAGFKSYEEAAEAAIKYCLTNLI